MADFWMYSDITPETMEILVRDHMLGVPYPDENRYITAEWERDTVVVTAYTEIHTDSLIPLTADDITWQLNKTMRDEFAKDLPELEWDITVEDDDSEDVPLWKTTLEIF